jgi:hypothetical protein
MFERFTEPARRALFFARYETSQIGGAAIEPEHLLLGLAREGTGIVADLFARADQPAARAHTATSRDPVRPRDVGRAAAGERGG